MAKRLNYEVGFNADTSQLKSALTDAMSVLNGYGNGSRSGFIISEQLDDAAKKAGMLGDALNSALDKETGRLDLSRFNESLKRSGVTLNEYAASMNKLGPDAQKAFINVAQAISNANSPLIRTNKLMSELWTTMKNTARWQLTSSALHTFVGALQTAYGYSKDLNRSLTDIRIVSGKSGEDMAKFAQEANKAAKSLNTTTVDYTDASLIYFQQGLSDEEVRKRTDVTIKLANVTGETAEEISQQMTAIWNNYSNGADNLERYADVLAALGAATASSSDEISQGIEKFSGVARTIGLSFDYAASALATITATTRESAEVVGTALKTLFSRIQGLKLGETLEDGTDLNKYSQALANVGVSIKDSNGELRNMDSILDDIGAKWGTLSKDQQVALAETVAG